MQGDVSVKPIADWTDLERDDLRALSQAVYPPEATAEWPGRHLQWAKPEWGVRVLDQHRRLVSYTGIVQREAKHDGRAALIGGVGGVQTHPNARNRGYAARGLQRAVAFLTAQPDVEFALLVCEPTLLDYYAKLGWQPFTGHLLTRQNMVTAEFSFNRVMVTGIQTDAPLTGTIDLCGPPW